MGGLHQLPEGLSNAYSKRDKIDAASGQDGASGGSEGPPIKDSARSMSRALPVCSEMVTARLQFRAHGLRRGRGRRAGHSYSSGLTYVALRVLGVCREL